MPAQPVEIKIQGMHCTGCASGVANQLRRIGFSEVDVDFASGTASFLSSDEDARSIAAAEISRLGYRVVDQGEGAAAELFGSIEGKFYFSLIWTIPLLLHMLLPFSLLHNQYLQLGLCVPVFALGVIHFGRSGLASLRAGTPNMDVLIIIGITAAFIYSLSGTVLNLGPDYLFYETSATITSLVLLGNLLEAKAVKKTTSAIEDLSRLQVRRAQRIVDYDGAERTEEIDGSSINKGDILLVNQGDSIPTDGHVIWGAASVDESMISGESAPVQKEIGAPVIGSTLVSAGTIKMQADAVGNETVLAHMIRLVRDARRSKASVQRLADRVSSVFVFVVLGIAILTLTASWLAFNIPFSDALLRSIAVLVIACPCAMGLATPTAIMVGIGQAAKHGILIRGGATIEQFAGIKQIIFDKTGTLTEGRMKVREIKILKGDQAHALAALAALERHSSHPIARSITAHLRDIEPLALIEVEEQRGVGVSGRSAEGDTYFVGSKMPDAQTEERQHDLYLLMNEIPLAGIDLEEELKPGAAKVVNALHARGISTALLSGDRNDRCQAIAQLLGIQRVFSEKLPEQKLEVIAALERETSAAFVGDGINDAPSLARATIGVSLSDASQAAINSSQIVLLNGRLEHLLHAIFIASTTLTTIKQNLFWAFFYNAAAIPLAAFGLLNPMIAALAMAFSDVIVIGNSLRLRMRKFAF